MRGLLKPQIVQQLSLRFYIQMTTREHFSPIKHSCLCSYTLGLVGISLSLGTEANGDKVGKELRLKQQ